MQKCVAEAKNYKCGMSMHNLLSINEKITFKII